MTSRMRCASSSMTGGCHGTSAPATPILRGRPRPPDATATRDRPLLPATPGLVRPLPDADLLPEKLRPAIVLFASLVKRPAVKAVRRPQTVKCGWGRDRRISPLLRVDPSTAAAGRQQFLKRNVELNRARRVGRRRQPSEKRRKSSPAPKALPARATAGDPFAGLKSTPRTTATVADGPRALRIDVRLPN